MDAKEGGNRFIAWPELKRRVPYTRQHIGRLEARGLFPRRIQLGAGGTGRVAWLESEIEDWIAARAGERDRPEAA